jgi:hypothetical protein
MTAAEIARALGGACRSGAWWRCRCPVHASGGPTLALRDGERALVTYCHGDATAVTSSPNCAAAGCSTSRTGQASLPPPAMRQIIDVRNAMPTVAAEDCSHAPSGTALGTHAERSSSVISRLAG